MGGTVQGRATKTKALHGRKKGKKELLENFPSAKLGGGGDDQSKRVKAETPHRSTANETRKEWFGGKCQEEGKKEKKKTKKTPSKLATLGKKDPG